MGSWHSQKVKNAEPLSPLYKEASSAIREVSRWVWLPTVPVRVGKSSKCLYAIYILHVVLYMLYIFFELNILA